MSPRKPRHLRDETATEQGHEAVARLRSSVRDPFSWLSLPPVVVLLLLLARSVGWLDISSGAFVALVVACLVVGWVPFVLIFAWLRRRSVHNDA